MQTLKRGLFSGLLLLVLPSLAHAQFGQFVQREVNIDYYLLNYFNRIAPLPRDVSSQYVNHYPVMNLFSPSFQYIHHDLDFLSSAQSVRSMAMGGAGVALQGGASALAVNPAGLLTGQTANEVYFGMTTRFGSGESEFADDLLVDSGLLGELEPLGASLDLRFLQNQGGLFMALRPFGSAEPQSGFSAVLGRLALAGGYRRFVEVANPTNSITNLLPEGGLQGLTAELKSVSQSREKGGVDAVCFALATGIGDAHSTVQLSVGGTANLVSGRIQADQVFTVSQLTQIRVSLPGESGIGSYIKQKITGTAFDVGLQAALLGGALRVGGTFRPSHALSMQSGRYSTIELGTLTGAPTLISIMYGRIADYDMELPSSLRVGGALSMTPLMGDGVDRRGILGYLHRLVGRAEIAVDYAQQNLSEATVRHVDEMLDNSQLAGDLFFQSVNLNLTEAFGPDAVVDPVMPHRNGNAQLRDKSSIHIGLDTPIFDRRNLQLDLRVGYETVPFSFASLVLGDRVDGAQGTERVVVRNADGTPVLEDVEGEAFTCGLGYTAGLVRFDVGFRSLSYDFVSWWGGAEPKSWYDPLTGVYEPLATENRFAALRTSGTTNSLQVSAALGF